MKNFTSIFVLILFLSACDSPRSQRALRSTSSNNQDLFTNNSTSGSGSSTTTSTPTPTSTSSTSTTSTVVIPDDAKHCGFASDGINGFASDSTHLGAHTLCQSSTDKNNVYFQIKTPPIGSNGSVSICFIPTYSSGSTSIYIGNPMCGTFSDPKQVRKISFIKYPQYSNVNVTGVIFFKDLAYYYYGQNMMTLDAYKTCMYYLAYGNQAYCQAFKSVGQYVYKQF